MQLPAHRMGRSHLQVVTSLQRFQCSLQGVEYLIACPHQTNSEKARVIRVRRKRARVIDGTEQGKWWKIQRRVVIERTAYGVVDREERSDHAHHHLIEERAAGVVRVRSLDP